MAPPAFVSTFPLGSPPARRHGSGSLTRCRPVLLPVASAAEVSRSGGGGGGGGGGGDGVGSSSSSSGAPRHARADAVTSGAAAGLSPRAEALIARQRQAPLFDPALLAMAAASAGGGGQSSLGTAASTAQAGGRFLTDDELRASAASTAAAAAAATLRDSVDRVIATARAAVGAAHPGIFDFGGGCSRRFGRPPAGATFGTLCGSLRMRLPLAARATGKGGWTSDAGAAIMADLYSEMAVPLPAMVTGVRALGTEARAVVSEAEGEEGGGEGVAAVDAAFGHLVARLESFV
ncbi:hypothetical protein MMPV_008158 [Pyropia vietnamensis]